MPASRPGGRPIAGVDLIGLARAGAPVWPSTWPATGPACDHAGMLPEPPSYACLRPPTDAEARTFVDGWRRATADGLPYYRQDEWIVFENSVLTGTTTFERDLLRAVFEHIIADYLVAVDMDPVDRRAAEDVFAFAIQTVLTGDPSAWRKVRTLARQIDTVSLRRASVLSTVNRALALLRDGKIDDALAETRHLESVDPAFANLDESKVKRWLAEAAPDRKGGAGRKGPHWVAGALAVSVGALGFKLATGAAFATAAATAARRLHDAGPVRRQRRA